ncbi:MAG TPA: hypothetical protein EYQ50_19895 [Verrucomicrobiales bacterium]|nr:hypothetical protein [Verrucomicrobiales bacterium]HIL68763.1 hypothetical protein [Verrucomicrobiota bacterium]
MSKSLQSVTRLTLGSDADTPNCLYLTLKKTRIALIVAILVILATRCFGGILNFRKYSSNEGLPDGLVRAMLQDREGYLWFGTQGGLCRFDGISFTIYSKKDGLKAVIIRSLCEDLEGNIWIGSRDNGLIVYDGKDFRPFTTNLDEIPNPNFIFEIKTDSGGDIWIGAKNGLYRISEGVVNRFTNDDGLPSTSIKSIYDTASS